MVNNQGSVDTEGKQVNYQIHNGASASHRTDVNLITTNVNVWTVAHFCSRVREIMLKLGKAEKSNWHRDT